MLPLLPDMLHALREPPEGPQLFMVPRFILPLVAQENICLKLQAI